MHTIINRGEKKEEGLAFCWSESLDWKLSIRAYFKSSRRYKANSSPRDTSRRSTVDQKHFWSATTENSQQTLNQTHSTGSCMFCKVNGSLPTPKSLKFHDYCASLICSSFPESYRNVKCTMSSILIHDTGFWVPLLVMFVIFAAFSTIECVNV